MKFTNFNEAEQFLKNNEVLWNQDWAWAQVKKNAQDGWVEFDRTTHTIMTSDWIFEVIYK